MGRNFATVFATAILFVPCFPTRAADGDAKSILEKGIKALGGEEKVAKIEAFSWKSKGTVTFNGEEHEFTGQTTAKGLDHFRREFSTDQFAGVVVLAGDKGWRKFGDNSSDVEGDGLDHEKRRVYLDVIPITLVGLKGKGFKYEAGAEQKVNDKPAATIKVTGPDGKEFTLAFDKETGLPVKLVGVVMGFQGTEQNMEVNFGDYKDFGGVKKATKIEVKRDGEAFQKFEVTEFKVLDKVDPGTFTEPK